MESNAPPQRPKNLCQVADYLLSPQSGVKKREGVFNESRVTYFRGKGAVNALLKPEFRQTAVGKELGELTRESAGELLMSMIPHQFFLRVARPSDPDMPKNMLTIVQYQSFSEDGLYLWRYEGSQLRNQLMAAGLLLIVLAAVMFPLWPVTLRLGVWYLSVGVLILLGLFFAMAIVRLILFMITWVVLKPGIWLFPNLFEDVGFVDSFIPLWGWHVPEPPKEVKKKGAVAGGEEPEQVVHTEVVSDETAAKIAKRRPMVEDAVDEDA
ncbi:Translocation protein S62 [Lobosporangium transversale]|uniref:Translocation protein SEC62 n=1 Tax=Lobosporangium transversale TaxID=64571 RepID=A0A1Y2GUC3_9FUNG|nr:translocation protein Sec62-domain-containing protein [Lobosporangium transversale]KAF9903385.1 Translocation protein S62 [Lobosporangium transversale]ORZ21939.1 translocation protein Sec62-domain-containing protein [Lobosporangium transversale]|eukprot:XP_021883190.1 translocation protein Sec62-domain-containing protein [Lobosporangium transversale]